MTTKFENGVFTQTTHNTFGTAFGSAGRDRQSLVARRNLRNKRRIARSV